MAQLGVFLIPEPEHPFCRAATGVMGYDIWRHRRGPSFLVGALDAHTLEQWLGFAPDFGIHCTIAGTALQYHSAEIPEIEARLAWIASRTAPFTLVNGRFATTFRGYPRSLAAAFDSPDGALQRLHRQVVTMVSPLQVSSNWEPWLPELADRPRELYVRTGEPWTLELFAPHWTFMSGLPDQAAWKAARELIVQETGLFTADDTRTLRVDAVHLVERSSDGSCRVLSSHRFTG